jgi:hypothetical protein
MDGETEGYLGGIFGEVFPSVPLMPIAVLSSVPSQIAVGAGPTSKLAKAGRPRGSVELEGLARSTKTKHLLRQRRGLCCWRRTAWRAERSDRRLDVQCVTPRSGLRVSTKRANQHEAAGGALDLRDPRSETVHAGVEHPTPSWRSFLSSMMKEEREKDDDRNWDAKQPEKNSSTHDVSS